VWIRSWLNGIISGLINWALDIRSTIASFFVRNPAEGIAEGVGVLFCSVDGSGAASCL